MADYEQLELPFKPMDYGIVWSSWDLCNAPGCDQWAVYGDLFCPWHLKDEELDD